MKCDLLRTKEDVLASYELALAGLQADVWLRASDTPESVAGALYEAITIEDEVTPCYTMDELEEVADKLYEMVSE